MTLKSSNIKNLNTFALPLLLQMLISYFIGATDLVIIGQISIEAFNASSLVSSTLQMVAGILGVITITLNIRLGESFGQGDKERFSLEFYSSIVTSVFLGILFFIFLILFGESILRTLYSIKGESLIQAMSYLKPMSIYML